MKTLRCSKELRNQIKNMAQPKEPVDSTLNRLLDLFENNLKNNNLKNDDFKSGFININIHESTYNRIKECKLDDKETMVSIIKRLINISESSNIEEPFLIKVNGISMSFDDFKSDFIDVMNLIFDETFDSVTLCTSNGVPVDKLFLTFS